MFTEVSSLSFTTVHDCACPSPGAITALRFAALPLSAIVCLSVNVTPCDRCSTIAAASRVDPLDEPPPFHHEARPPVAFLCRTQAYPDLVSWLLKDYGH